MVLGIGGEEGWIHYEVIKRYKSNKCKLLKIIHSNRICISRVQNLSMNYKNDISKFFFFLFSSEYIISEMKFILFPDFERFKGFLETALQKMEEPEKSFVIMDNASYHSKLVNTSCFFLFSVAKFPLH